VHFRPDIKMMRDIQKMMDRFNKPAFFGRIDDVEHAIKRKCPF
jgi:hypothetical protein